MPAENAGKICGQCMASNAAADDICSACGAPLSRSCPSQAPVQQVAACPPSTGSQPPRRRWARADAPASAENAGVSAEASPATGSGNVVGLDDVGRVVLPGGKGKGHGRGRGNIGSSGMSFQEVKDQQASNEARSLQTAREREENFTRGDMRKFDKWKGSRPLQDGRSAGAAFNAQDLRKGHGKGKSGGPPVHAHSSGYAAPGGEGHTLGEASARVVEGSSACPAGSSTSGSAAAPSVEELRAKRLARFG
eukprot:gnl/TRDRNA2_/TRDRNA2_32511_c0_seq2.p1 gnl/TRDRNA2_/TRDRNA2_32511_c0~~gnl/TRDRNA2_/TRDRNA2_32511_c0_seq2.p1  ORF type:complete len:250 (-),score=58.02 gnl/TRDRNA2_/TRDRNA2_32511_c0_seq2:100-849(-)